MSCKMDKKAKIKRSAGMMLFSLGILLGMALAGGAAWADFEAVFYGFHKLADKPLPGLRCPVLMTFSETGTVAATFANPADRPIQLMVRTDVSGRARMRSERTTLALAPGETKQAHWIVTSDDIDLGFFIFVQVSSYPAYPLPFRGSTCGILVLNLPLLTGGQIFAFTLVTSLLGIVVGLSLWQASHRPLVGRSVTVMLAMRFLAMVVLLGMFAAFRGEWLFSGLLLVIAVLMVVGVVTLELWP